MASVIVMPASPVAQLRASPSLSTATASTAPATPRLSLVDADGGPPRASSESSVLSIYDMYGRPGSGAWTAVERQGSRDSYAAAGGLPTVAPDYPAQTSKRPSSRLVAPPEPRQQPSRLSAVDSARSSAVIYTLDTDDAYAYDAPAAYTPPHRQSSLHAPLSARPPASRPTSTRAPPIPRSLADEHLLAPAARPSSSTYADDPMARPASGSRVLSSQSLDPRAMPLPLSTRSSFAPSRHASPGPPLPATPPPSTPARDRLSVHDASPGSIPGPSSPRKFGAGPSTHSLVPSAGEDSDSFFVRATYAELDQSGVKGDGFVEGVERTRARVGPSRASELLAEQARGDGSERSAELGPAEQRVLASLDRYGFFVVANHDRLVALPVNAFAKPLTPLPTGATAGPAQPPHLPALPQGAPSPKEAERISKWGRMLEPQARDKGGNVLGWSVRAPKERKFRGRVYKGIPDRWRAAAWPLMMARFSRSGDAEMARMRGEYRAALELPSQYDVQIDLDVPRTISGHVMFRTRYGMGQRSLFHVLHSFSLRCETCGYVQGMGPIAATLLCYLEPEAVYGALVRLHDAYALHAVFAPGFPGLLESIFVQERLMETHAPAVYAACKRHMVSTTAYATKWYITLFANSVPFQTQLRLWDVFLLEGPDTFVVIALAIVWTFRDNITASAASFETILSLLSSFFVPEDEDVLLLWIGRVLGDAKLRAQMAAWRQEWQGLVAAGKDGTALL